MMAVGSILMSINYDPTLCMRVQSKKTLSGYSTGGETGRSHYQRSGILYVEGRTGNVSPSVHLRA